MCLWTLSPWQSRANSWKPCHIHPTDMSYQKLKLNKRQAQHESVSQMGIYSWGTNSPQTNQTHPRPKQWTMRMRSVSPLENMPNSAVNSVFITFRLSLTRVCPICKSSEFSATNTRFCSFSLLAFPILFIIWYCMVEISQEMMERKRIN